MGRAGHKILALFLFIPGVGIAAWSMVYNVWPILVFFVLHTAALYWMVRYHWFVGQCYEDLQLSRDHLTITRVSPSGESHTEKVSPQWLQVVYPNVPEKDAPLMVGSHGRTIEIGTFLAPQEKYDLSLELHKALRNRRDALIHLTDE